MTNKHSQRTWWWLKCAGSLFSGSLLCMFGTDRVQGRWEPLILSLGRPRCSCEGQCQVCFICRGNAQPLYVQLIRHRPKRNVFGKELCFFFLTFCLIQLTKWGFDGEGSLYHILRYLWLQHFLLLFLKNISWLTYFNQTMLTVLLSLLEKSSYLYVSYLLLLFLNQEDKITVVPNRRHVSEGRFSQ